MSLSSLSHWLQSLQDASKKYRALLGVLLLLTAAGITGNFLRGELLSGDDSSTEEADNQPTPEEGRACTSKGTPFEDEKNLEKIIDIFEKEASAVVDEREQYLSTPSQWSCPMTGLMEDNTSTEKLQALAKRLPGWHFNYKDPEYNPSDPLHDQEYVLRPVTFETFSSILMELQRTYECTLNEIDEDRSRAIINNVDAPKNSSYCCTDNGCAIANNSDECYAEVPTSDDPQCSNACTTTPSYGDITTRAEQIHQRIAMEKRRALIAIERTLLALRSAEIHYADARDLRCYMRASLDFKNLLSLLADATSCMPKIWDALTSLHDRFIDQ